MFSLGSTTGFPNIGRLRVIIMPTMTYPTGLSSRQSVAIIFKNTPGSAGGPGGREKKKKQPKIKIKITFKIIFFSIYLLFMPKYWVKNYFAHGRFPEVGQKQKTEGEKRMKEREKERKTEQ